MNELAHIRVLTDKGWEEWDDVKEITVPYPQRIPRSWHMSDNHQVVVDTYWTMLAGFPTVITSDGIVHTVYEIDVVSATTKGVDVTTWQLGGNP